MQESVFTKIIKGELPSYKVYDSTHALAFLDIHPVQPGMTVVVSKRQVENFYELEGEEYSDLWEAVHVVAKHLATVFPDKKRIAVQVEGLDVAHVHVKLFPINTTEELHARADMDAPIDHDALTAMVEKVKVV